MAGLTICDACFNKDRSLPAAQRYVKAAVEFKRQFSELTPDEGFVRTKGQERVHHLCKEHHTELLNMIQDFLHGYLMEGKEVVK